MIFEIKDINVKGQKAKVEIQPGENGFEIFLEDYGTSAEENGAPLYIEFQNGTFVVYIWGDINSEDPTNVISLRNAKEELYQEKVEKE